MTLEQLFDKHQCDKSSKHRYHEIYESYFAPVRQEPIKILEIGVYKAASTKALLEYFPNATIHGVDVFDRVSLSDIDITDDRVTFFKSDSTSEDLVPTIRKAFKNIKYDFIIDDAMHTPLHNRLTLENTQRLLKSKGVYFIEDVWPWDIMTEQEKKHHWMTRYPERYNDRHFDQFFQALSESEFRITRHDYRGVSGQPDSCIIALAG